jgi:hypothetical protein
MPFRVVRALEAVGHVEHMGEPLGLRGQGRRHAPHPAAAQEEQFLARLQPGIAQLIHETGIYIAGGEILPGYQHRLFAGAAQIGNADILPFGIGTHVHQMRLGIRHQRFPRLCNGHILHH